MLNGEIKKAHRRLIHGLFAGIAGLLASAVFVLVTLWMQEYSTAAFLMISLFIFPVPVACGFAVGLVSPRKVIVWAPLWAAVFTFLLFTFLPGGIHDVRLALSPFRLLCMVIGIVLAAIAGLAAQYASARGYVVRMVLIFLVMCCGMGIIEYVEINCKQREFERDIAPIAVAEVNEDYIALPRGMDWRCVRRPEGGCYKLSSYLEGRIISILVRADGPRISGINYERTDKHMRIRGLRDAKDYLKKLGFRDALLSSLSRQKAGARNWCANLDGTRLTLTCDGHVKMQDPAQELQRSYFGAQQ